MNVIQDKPETMSGLDFRESLEGQPQLFDKCDIEKNTDWSRLDIRESLEVQNLLLRVQPEEMSGLDIRESLEVQNLLLRVQPETMNGWHIRESLEVQNILLKGQPCLFDKCDIEKMDGEDLSPYYKLNGAWPELKKTRIQTSLQKIFFNNFVDPIGDKIFNFMYPLN